MPIVVNHGGVVNRIDGDAMLAFFGILRITNAKSAMARLRNRRGDDAPLTNWVLRAREPVMVTGIGITTGVVIAGV